MSQAGAAPDWEGEQHQVQLEQPGGSSILDSIPFVGDTDWSHSESLELFGATVPEEEVGFLEG